jgi:hypothetical protein
MPKNRRRWPRCVDPGGGTGQHLQTDPALLQIGDRADEVFQGMIKTVELPDDEHIARLQGLQAVTRARPVIPPAGRQVV